MLYYYLVGFRYAKMTRNAMTEVIEAGMTLDHTRLVKTYFINM